MPTLHGGVMKCRKFTARRGHDSRPNNVSRARSVFRQQDFHHQLSFKPGDHVLIPIENLGSELPVGIHESNGEVGNLALDNLDPEDFVTGLRIHGTILEFGPADPHLPIRNNNIPYCESPEGATGGPQWEYKYGDAFFLRPLMDEYIDNGKDRRIEVFNIRTGRPLIVTPKQVKFLASYRYIGTSQDQIRPRKSNVKRPVFQTGDLLTVAERKPRDLYKAEGKAPPSKLLFAVKSTTGEAGWVFEDKIQQLSEDEMENYDDVIPIANGSYNISSALGSMDLNDYDDNYLQRTRTRSEASHSNAFSPRAQSDVHSEYYDEDAEFEAEDEIDNLDTHGLPSPMSLYGNNMESPSRRSRAQTLETTEQSAFLPKHAFTIGPKGQKRMNIKTLEANQHLIPNLDQQRSRRPPPEDIARLQREPRVPREYRDYRDPPQLLDSSPAAHFLPPGHFNYFRGQINREQDIREGIQMARMRSSERHREPTAPSDLAPQIINGRNALTQNPDSISHLNKEHHPRERRRP
ncbi:hypothetical protein H072_1933 [Dactylellina haptotyla CBS 200.50]|uniref:Uncharacterized protein n=1 Tax=Dactylellina haptotyla (strain CBS 200.50) TaxID=1284197 RepID=S8AMI7_DACHA|nr:hypothetical protein H072_1933 [Dactylellina haptotyla CBS 200.50]